MTKVTGREKAKREPFRIYLKNRLKNVPLTIIMGLFVAFCLASLIYFAVLGGDRSRDCFICLAYMATVPVFYLAEYSLNMRAPLGYTVFLLLFVLFCFLGACYNFYYIIPCLDDILHAAWGIVFSVMGIMLIKAMIGAPKTVKGVIACVLFGVGFAMLLSVAWEIYEYTGDRLIPDMDMQQDDIIKHIHSFVMYPNPDNPAPDNLHTWKVTNILYTDIFFENAEGVVESVRIPNGYLDVGLTDTMHDLIWCFATTAVFSVALGADWCTRKYFYRFMIPSLAGEKYDKKGNAVECEAQSAPAEEKQAEVEVEVEEQPEQPEQTEQPETQEI